MNRNASAATNRRAPVDWSRATSSAVSSAVGVMSVIVQSPAAITGPPISITGCAVGIAVLVRARPGSAPAGRSSTTGTGDGSCHSSDRAIHGLDVGRDPGDERASRRSWPGTPASSSAEQEGRDRHPVVQELQVRGVGRRPPRHPQHADREQRQERRVEEHERRPEVDLAQRLVELDARHLRQPVVEAGEEGEHQPAHDRVVEVGHHEVAAVQADVARHVGQEDAREAADQEVEEEREREQHRHRVADPGPPQRSHPDQEDEARSAPRSARS